MAKRVLIVDDDVGFAQILQLNLEAGNYIVRVENDSSRALTVAREFRPDIVLLDLVMPYQDGGGFAAHLQNDDALGDVPIVFLTAMLSQSASPNIEREIAGRAVVAKPVHYQDLVDCIERHTSSS